MTSKKVTERQQQQKGGGFERAYPLLITGIFILLAAGATLIVVFVAFVVDGSETTMAFVFIFAIFFIPVCPVVVAFNGR